MKPKYQNIIRKTLPLIIIVPALSQLTNAAVISTAGNGSLIVTAADNGANHIVANGGATPIVTIDSGTILLNDPTFDSLLVNSAGYSIVNAGSLTSALSAISSPGFSTDITNSGTLSGGVYGINVAGGILLNQTVITNSGSITSVNDAIQISSAYATVTNNLGGTITATGSQGDGIEGFANLTVTNYGTISATSANSNADGVDANGDSLTVTNSGTISANGGNGIEAQNLASITNNDDAQITSTLGNGISIGNGDGIAVNISNSGDILGGTNGILGGNDLVINNNQVLSSSIKVDEGTITGTVDGINVGNFANIDNKGTITGTTGDGIQAVDNLTLTNSDSIHGGVNGVIAGDNATVTNNALSTISGDLTGTGVWLDDGATVTNSGSITGGISGVRISDNSTVTNNYGATISGALAIDAFGSPLGFFVLNNSGTITSTGTGTVAIDGVLGIDTLNLNAGSLVTGDILLNSGADIVNMTSDDDYSSIVNGDIIGGSDTDTLTFDGGKTEPSGTTNAITGDVSMETINKLNSGTAFITGNVLTDTITLSGGGLYINGNVSELIGGAPATQIAAAAGTELGGTGTWTADIALTNATISAGEIPASLTTIPTDAIGTLNLVGNVTSTGANTIRYDVQPQSSTPVSGGLAGDLINHIGGTYGLGTGMTVAIAPTSINQAMSNGTYTVINSDAVITGALPSLAVQFDDALVPDSGLFIGSLTGGSIVGNTVLEDYFTTVSLINGSSDLVFTIDHNFAGLPGLTDNESALGGAIDQSINSLNSNVQDFIAAMDYSDLSTVQETLASLNPERYLSQAVAVMNGNYRLHRMTQQHLAAVRGAETTTHTTPAASGAKGAIPAQTTSSANKGNAWGAYSYDSQDYSASNSRHDYDGDTSAFTAGFDWRVSSDFVLGIVLDGSASSYDSNGSGNSSDLDSLRGAVYGTWGQSMGLYSDFLVGYGTHNMDMSRSFGGVLSGFDGDSSSDASSLQALWTVGYTMGNASIKHGPYAGLEYQNVDVDGFNENGPLPLSVDDYDVDSLRGLIGYRVDGSYNKFHPYASVAYAHEFENDKVQATASFDGNSFSVEGDELGSAILLSVGTGYSFSEKLSMDIGYRGEFSVDNDGVDSNGGTIGLNYSF